ncbi:SGNH/GDSL hydrolase family protein [Actinosynnema mirum]|uniref:Lipolytic protein G-D-S-L family n=1 Tax=Actinosynnema mirum (strain ATCC 29888 / DSM 43827 / JCM 3225 / NBRC 14064 / NCIMB 13271 / NRRL B-12336 / IMRU 3971 / 101) TaxID=446462 RepID=C6WC39_ACTMD|nr:SGNH/GDSL hydrolase family protein [Actinosynnema mirum]ACU39427.1 lipolytic protein G-D-S-L family [Actinosynnema mirum DSM 43827]
MSDAPPSLWAWHQARTAHRLRPVRIVCVGSSTTAGLNATQPDRRYASALGHAIRGYLGTVGGWHLRGIDPAWSTTGTTSDVGRGLGLHSRSLAAGATMTTPSVQATGFTILFEQGAGAGAFTWAVDGGSTTTVTPDTGNSQVRHDGSVYVSAGSLGAHTLTITATAATVISGVYVHNGDQTAGVQVFNAGSSGTGSADWTGTGAPMLTHLSRIAALDPSLVIVMIGSNDSGGSVDPRGAYRANVRQQVAQIRAACPRRVSILLVHSYGRYDLPNATYRWSQYGAALAEIAASTPDVDVLDLSPYYPTSQAADVTDLISADGIHQGDEGHALMADLIARYLTAPAELASVPSSLGAPVGAPPATLPGLIAAWRSTDLGNSAQATLPSWAPYAGSQSAPLAQATGSKQPSVVADALGAGSGVPAVRFSGTAAQVMQTAAWSATYPVPLTVLLVARPDSTNYTLFSGASGSYVYLGQSASPGLMALGAGAASEAYAYTGAGRARVYGVVFAGAGSRVLTHDGDLTALTTGTGAAAKLDRWTLNGNSTASLNGNCDVYEALLFSRALSDQELAESVTWLARRYGLDGVGRTSL